MDSPAAKSTVFKRLLRIGDELIFFAQVRRKGGF